MAETTRACSSFKVQCNGCGLGLVVLTDDEEAELRLIEFAAEHRSHYHVPVDKNGMLTVAFGTEHTRERV